MDAVFFMLSWARYGFYKKRVRICYVNLVFLHLVGSADHIIHSGALGARNIDALFLMLR
jgi:hypothetical protein